MIISVPDVSGTALHWLHGVADVGALGAFGHAGVAQPAAIDVHAIVTHHVGLPALGGLGGVAGNGAD